MPQIFPSMHINEGSIELNTIHGNSVVTVTKVIFEQK